MLAWLTHAQLQYAVCCPQDLSLAQQKGAPLRPGLLECLAAQEDRVDHYRVLGFRPGTDDTVDTLSR